MADWTADQRANASTIIQVGTQLGASTRDIQIALMAAMQESELRNLSYGDRDSVGLFQQRNAWGTFAQRTNPAEAARMFFTGGHAGQRGLLSFADRDHMGLAQAAQAVQVSAYPDAYAKWQNDAESLLGGLGHGSTAGTLGAVPGLDTLTQTPKPPVPPADATQSLAAVTADSTGLDPFQGTGAPDENSTLGAVQFSGNSGAGFLDQTDDGALPVAAATNNLMSDTHLPTLESYGLRAPGSLGMGDPGGVADATDTGAHGWRKAVVTAAKKMLGTPYVWGGTNYNGVDCSGLVQLVYDQYGFKMPRISAEQARTGERIPIADAKPGDLIAYDNSSRNIGADHIAIALGNGYMIEAPKPGSRVQVSKIYDGGWAVRVNSPAGYTPPRPAPNKYKVEAEVASNHAAAVHAQMGA